jgi:para-nitrobenzyl esterase
MGVWSTRGGVLCGVLFLGGCSGGAASDDSGQGQDSGGEFPEDSGQVEDSGTSDTGPPRVFAEGTFDVEVTVGEIYGQGLTHADWNAPDPTPMDLLLDLYTPADASGVRPALVIIHGGGFFGGSRQQAQLVEVAEYFTGRGFLCVSIDYRLASDRGTLPPEWLTASNSSMVPEDQRDQVRALYPAGRDAKAAVRWLHANAASLGVSPDHVAVLGGSAGAFQAMMLGVTEPEDYRDELDLDADSTLGSTNLASSAEVHTLIDLWGGTAQITMLDQLYQLDRWDAEDAPVAIVHGTEDPTVSFTEAEAIRDAYEGTGVNYAFHPLDGAGHGAWGARVDGMSLSQLAFEFIVTQQGLLQD